MTKQTLKRSRGGRVARKMMRVYHLRATLLTLVLMAARLKRRTSANQRAVRVGRAATATLMQRLQMVMVMVMVELGVKMAIVRMALVSAKGAIGIAMERTRMKTSIEPSARGVEADATRKKVK